MGMEHQDTHLSGTRTWLWHTCGRASLAPVAWQAWATPSRRQGHDSCIQSCTLVFPVPDARPSGGSVG